MLNIHITNFLLLVIAVVALPVHAATFAENFLQRHNAIRTANGVPTLTLSQQLTTAAEGHCRYNATTGTDGHIESNGSTPTSRANAVGPATFRTVWENVAYGSVGLSDDFIMNLWMNEPPGNDPHRQTILSSVLKCAGFAKCTNGADNFYVADFGADGCGTGTSTNPGGSTGGTNAPAIYQECTAYTDDWHLRPNGRYFIFYQQKCFKFNPNTGIMKVLLTDNNGVWRWQIVSQ